MPSRNVHISDGLNTLIAQVRALTRNSDEQQVLLYMLGKAATRGRGSNQFGLNHGSICLAPFMLDHALELEPWVGYGGKDDSGRLKRNRQRIVTAVEGLSQRGLTIMKPICYPHSTVQRELNDEPIWDVRLNI